MADRHYLLEGREEILKHFLSEGIISRKQALSGTELGESTDKNNEEIEIILDNLVEAGYLGKGGGTWIGTMNFRTGQSKTYSESPTRYWLTERGIAQAQRLVAASEKPPEGKTEVDHRTRGHFVDPDRIEELGRINSNQYDLIKLIQICEELNICYANECYLAVTMLCRAVMDHVPPIFNRNCGFFLTKEPIMRTLCDYQTNKGVQHDRPNRLYNRMSLGRHFHHLVCPHR